MSRSYHAAVECIARWTGARLRRHLPHHPQIFICNASAGTRHRHRSVRAVAHRRCGGDGELPELWWTTSGEEARERVAARLEGADSAEPVIVSLGGDGTHNHVLQAGLDCDSRGLFLRLPLGSGNDAAGTESLEQSLADLDGVMVPRWIPAVRILTPNWERYAFNIASVGLDAYVTILHEKWRRILPGNTYRLLVDLAVLRYEQALEVGSLKLRGTAFDGSTDDLGDAPRSLVAMGASGNRTYGDHMRVLPGEENVCVIERAGLWEKLRMKQLFYEGRHVDEPITAMYRLQRLVAEYSGTLPLQYDGEAQYLTGDDFPLTMEAVRSAIRVLVPDRMSSVGTS